MIVDDEQTAVLNLKRILKKLVPDAALYMTTKPERAFGLCRERDMDVVFLDIRMPDKDGLTLAREIREIRPDTNIIIVTAHPEYALDAFKLYASDYILKPAVTEDVKKALLNLRKPVKQHREGLYVQCFGHFTVFYDGKPMKFGRSKIQELFAYLIDRRGATCSNAQLRAVLWKDDVRDDDRQRHYFAQIVHEFRDRLSQIGCGEIFVQSRDSYAVVPELIECDYYHALRKEQDFLADFTGEYMSQYEWADMRVGTIEKELKGGKNIQNQEKP